MIKQVYDEEEVIKEFFREGIAVRSSPNIYGQIFFIRITKDFYEMYEPSETHVSRNDPEETSRLEHIAFDIEMIYRNILYYLPYRNFTLSSNREYGIKRNRETLKDLIKNIRNEAKRLGEALNLYVYDDYI